MNLDQFNYMHFQTKRLLRDEYYHFLTYSRGPVVDCWATSYLQAKLFGGKPVRAQFVIAMSDWLLGLKASWFHWIKPNTGERLYQGQLPLIVELIISIQYLHNQILDGKAGVNTRERIGDNLLLANLLKEQLYRYIDGEVSSSRERQLITTYVRRCFEWVDLGQQLERQANNYTRMHQHELSDVLPANILQQIDLQAVQAFIDKTKQELPRFLHQELDHYFHRIYLTCAALFVNSTQLIGALLKLPTHKMDAPLQFSVCYGIMRQMVNDNADWVVGEANLHTQEKAPKDVFSDLRNQTLTLPLFFWLAEHRPQDKMIQQLLNQPTEAVAENQDAVFQEIIESHALFRAVQHVRILAELALAFLPAERKELAKACEIAHWNKFIVPVVRHAAYPGFRQTAAHRRTKKLIRQLRHIRQGSTSIPVNMTKEATRKGIRRKNLPLSARRALLLLQA